MFWKIDYTKIQAWVKNLIIEEFNKRDFADKDFVRHLVQNNVWIRPPTKVIENGNDELRRNRAIAVLLAKPKRKKRKSKNANK